MSPNPSRRRLGQVFTPPPVADWMARWACARRPRRLLDPAVGRGVFVDAVERALPARNPRPRIDVFDIDPAMLAAFNRRPRTATVRCRRADFLTAPIPDRYDAILANPPYIRHHDLAYDERILARFDRLCGLRLSRLTNLYGLFLVRIWNLLAPAGRAAIITPGEWLNADFGRPLKDYLLRENALEAIVHFDHAALVFEGALTTAVITLLRRGRARRTPVRLLAARDIPSLQRIDLRRGLRMARSDLDPARKWTPLFHGAAGAASPAPGGPTLADIACCTRGIATGANHFFTLCDSARRRWRLDPRDLSLCITKARQITAPALTPARLRRLVESDQRVYLFDPRPRLTAAVRRYLEEGRRLGIDRRYLPAHRPAWFRPEHRRPAPIWVSVFARGAFRFVRNTAGVLNLTPFHAITLHAPNPRRLRALFDFLTGPEAHAALRLHRRTYADGLFKLEPRDVLALPIPPDLHRLCRPGAKRS